MNKKIKKLVRKSKFINEKTCIEGRSWYGKKKKKKIMLKYKISENRKKIT